MSAYSLLLEFHKFVPLSKFRSSDERIASLLRVRILLTQRGKASVWKPLEVPDGVDSAVEITQTDRAVCAADVCVSYMNFVMHCGLMCTQGLFVGVGGAAFVTMPLRRLGNFPDGKSYGPKKVLLELVEGVDVRLRSLLE